MRFRFSRAAAIALAASLVVSYAHASDSTPPVKKHAKKATTPPPPSVQEQIDALRQQMQTQIDGLKNDLSDKDTQLKQAQQSAADAQAAAAKAQAAVDAQQAAFSENSAAVSTLQSTVTDMKAANASIVSSLTDETSSIRKAITNPDALYYKGITISPAGSFLAAETVWRQGATGGDINTPFTGVPLNNSDASQLSEFFGSGRQSRIAIKAVGKLPSMTLSGYYEMDWLSAGATSNANQSNSYTVRQRQLWADAKLNSGWDFSGGQGWSLVTETTAGLTRGTEILPAVIDAQYVTGFAWTRQYSFRVSKDIDKKFFIGASLENAEMLNPSGQNLPSNYLFGSTGTGGGLYNAGANYSFNYTPDFIVKVAMEPGWGHWELFGVERNFRDRIYPNTPSGTGAYNDSKIGAGIGGGFRGPLAHKKVTVGLKGLWGQGVGRYGSSTIADVTIRPDGTLSPLHGFSALSTVELNPTPRLNLYVNYGADYIGRDWTLNTAGTEVGYGTLTTNMSGCLTETFNGTAGAGGAAPIAPANCGGSNKDVQEFTIGDWYNIYNGPKGRLRQGFQYAWFERDLWSGAGGATNSGGGAHGTDNMFWTSLRYYLP
jgi:Skp family chaperone for outer membrane proteins